MASTNLQGAKLNEFGRVRAWPHTAGSGNCSATRAEVCMMNVRFAIFLLVLTQLSSFPVSAQVPASDTARSQSLQRESRLAGRKAADKVSVRSLFLPAFIGGASLGAGSVMFTGDDRESTIAGAFLTGAGVAIIATTATGTSRSPSALASGISPPGSVRHAASFESAFAERLRERQRNTITLGSLSGVLAGTAAMYLLISQLLST